MGRQMDEPLWEAWWQRLARYEQWDGAVAAFCLREGVSTNRGASDIEGDRGGCELT